LCGFPAGYWWWLATAAEFEYSNIYSVVLNWRKRIKYREVASMYGLEVASDSRRYVDIDGALHPTKQPNNAEELAFLAAMKKLQDKAGKLRTELDAIV
jgi:hypothetical protein